MANYAFVVDNSFQPFSMQEMLVPFSAYKDAYEKSEEQYNDRTGFLRNTAYGFTTESNECLYRQGGKKGFGFLREGRPACSYLRVGIPAGAVLRQR